MSSSNSMFASYNGASNHTTRVGNWQEELVLKEASGHNRGPGGNPAKHLQGSMRCIEHTDRVESSDWKSSQGDAHQHPASRKEYVDIKKSIKSRLKQHEEEWAKQADQDLQQEKDEMRKTERIGQYDTEFTQSFKRGSFGKERLPAKNDSDPHYTEGPASTLYSHAIAETTGHNAHYFKRSCDEGSVVSFKRNTGFTNDIRDPNKASSQAW